jgi:hypothetical protein
MEREPEAAVQASLGLGGRASGATTAGMAPGGGEDAMDY